MSDLVKMQKDGTVLEVNPVAVKQHEELGWTYAPKEAKPTVLDEGPSPAEIKAAAKEEAKK